MLLESYRPQSCLVSKDTPVAKPRFSVVDAHNHLGEEFGGGWTRRPVEELIEVLDQVGVGLYVDLDGGWGEDVLIAHLEKFKSSHPERFKVFGGVNWDMWKSMGDGFPDWAAERLISQKKYGAEGLKIWKNLGLRVCDQHGELVQVDDKRLEPLWLAAGELDLPVIIHVADPVAFFNPLDETNERWEELNTHPDWQFPSPPFPSFSTIIQGLANLVRRNPRTIFIGAHVGCYAENLSWVGNLLKECPNLYVDISARIGELGRQPYTSRKFFIDNADRILFGSDCGPDIETYRITYRFLETEDEFFNYSSGEIPLQGRWYIYGIYLPDEVLEKIYHLNFEKIFK
jgi:predicted TIM-barrel fold metal-dependent hydrolase